MQREIEKVRLLLQQERYTQAEQILKDMLSQFPIDLDFLILLAEVYLQQACLDQAEELIDQAMGIYPEESIVFYQKARLLIESNNYAEAEYYLGVSLQLDPASAHAFALWAAVNLKRKKYVNALELADKSLELDAENLFALNTRSSALFKLNRHKESFQTIQGALREDPNNAYTHANYGWNLLQSGDYKKALGHFKEALRIDPDFDFAKEGMAAALKANNVFYRAFLSYSFWMGELSQKKQWMFIIGIYLLARIARTISAKNELLASMLNPVLLAFSVLVFLTWVITPLSNLLFRLHPYGKHLLSRKDIKASNFVGVSLLIAFLAAVVYCLTWDSKWVTIIVFGIAMILPLGTLFSVVNYAHTLIIYAGIMGAIGVAAIVIAFVTNELVNTFSVLFFIGFIAFQWVANVSLIKQANE